jgi:hypothetical protein
VIFIGIVREQLPDTRVGNKVRPKCDIAAMEWPADSISSHIIVNRQSSIVNRQSSIVNRQTATLTALVWGTGVLSTRPARRLVRKAAFFLA